MTPSRSPFAHPRGLTGWLAGKAMAFTNRGTAQNMVRRLRLTGSEDVLEIGVGPGLGLEAAVGRCGRLAGVDISELMVETARARVPGADVRVAGVSALPWEDHAFDRVCSMNSVMLWPNLPEDLREIVRVLRPGGRIVIAVRDHSIHQKYGGLMRPQIDGIAERLTALGLTARVEHEAATAFIEADRHEGPGA